MLLIGNGRVITRDQENPYLEDGAVVISGEKIKEVGSLTEMKAKYPEAEFVDAKGGVIMPGLINAHTHIYSGLARGLSIAGNNPTNFLEVLDGTWWAIDRHLTLDGTKACAYATVLDCIRNGVTTIFDHHASFGEISGSLFVLIAAFQIGVECVGQARVFHRHLGQGEQVLRRGLQRAAAKSQRQRQIGQHDQYFPRRTFHGTPSPVSIFIQNILYHISLSLGSPCFAFSPVQNRAWRKISS